MSYYTLASLHPAFFVSRLYTWYQTCVSGVHAPLLTSTLYHLILFLSEPRLKKNNNSAKNCMAIYLELFSLITTWCFAPSHDGHEALCRKAEFSRTEKCPNF